MEHQFTKKIIEILEKNFGERARDVFEKSSLLQYINIKTRSATRGSKAREVLQIYTRFMFWSKIMSTMALMKERAMKIMKGLSSV